MSLPLKTVWENLSANEITSLKDAEILSVRFFRTKKQLEIALSIPHLLPFADYAALREKIQEKTGCACRIRIDAKDRSVSLAELQKYIADICRQDPVLKVFANASVCCHEQENTLDFIFANEQEADLADQCTDHLIPLLADAGLDHPTLNCQTAKPMDLTVENVRMPDLPQPKPAEQKADRRHYGREKKSDYTAVKLHDMTMPADRIQFEGTIFAKEDFVVRSTQRTIQSLSVFDGTDAMIIKRYENRSCTKEQMAEIDVGDRVHVYGRIINDSYVKDLVCEANEIDKLEPLKITDPAPEKRVELHCHTNMSEMDGVCESAEIVQYVWNLGHDGLAITDHADVQSFVKAFNAAAVLKKSDPKRKFQVAFGCEMNMVDEHLTIVRNVSDVPLGDAEYVCFDLETTGLSCYYDHIIEFGAVKVKNQTVIDRRQMFIKPPISIPAAITNKTNITNDMVKNAKSFADSCQEILDWIGDDVLVAHNATFDYGFLNEELRRIGRPRLNNTVIDTLDLARAILSERRAYRLGNVARYYRIAYDEEVAHRADYDAETLAGVFLGLLKDAAAKGAKTIRDLQEGIQDERAFIKVRHSHICVLVKNQKGIKDLYELITESNTKTLAVMGKASGKEGSEIVSEPRIFRSSLAKKHENLLFGSACLNGEIFELACNGDDARLQQAMQFYDYIEVQPPGNYSTAIALSNLPDQKRLLTVLRRIIDTARKLGKPVCATSDAHYCTKDQKIFRDVYINNQGVGGAAHPLFIRDEQLRLKTPSPDQHIRLTDEMKQEFSWLKDDQLIDEIVVKNPHQILNLIEDVRPVPAGTFPPFIEGSAEKLSAVCYQTANAVYGDPLPEPVKSRLEKELKAIITHGYAVVYYISHLLVKKSNSDGYLVGSRGSVGSSFVATMAGITEVNPLKPHYICPHCKHSEFITDSSVRSGFDMPDKKCPVCGSIMKGNGQNIPFETFLGFKGDKVPDIDLNFSNEYQAKAHAFTKEVFGEDHVFRAGTIGTVAEKTAFGYVSGYCEKMNITNMRRAYKEYLAKGCQNVKRTTGQHPGGIIVIPNDRDAADFTPVQYPANEPSSEWKTTHFDFHDIHDNVLKFDILGHVDPTAMRLLQNISGIDPKSIPMNDPATLSLFSSSDALKADPRIYHEETGAVGLPEFGTKITRRVLEMTRPKTFSDLVIISGLSHGTDVWAGNAQTLVEQGHPLQEVIGCRDDIMTYLLGKSLEPSHAFQIMEHVRKGKGLSDEEEQDMKAHQVPDWYIDSCRKIKYMFPKAHAVAYVIMAIRIAWFKVHYPYWFYVQFLTLRCDAYEIETMTKGIEAVRARMQDIDSRRENRFSDNPVSNKEKSLYDTLEVCEEMYARGYRVGNIDLYKSKATEFCVLPEDLHTIIPPFSCIDGLGDNVARSIEEAREKGQFLSKEDLQNRTQLSATLIRKLEVLGCLAGLQDKNQISLF